MSPIHPKAPVQRTSRCRLSVHCRATPISFEVRLALLPRWNIDRPEDLPTHAQPNQDFEVSAAGVLHLPTKARFTPPLEDGPGLWEDGTLGTPLGIDYVMEDIKKKMMQLWHSYLQATA